MSNFDSINTLKTLELLKHLEGKIAISGDFYVQNNQIKTLLRNDNTGLINTILDFMIHTATVDLNIETSNDTVDSTLSQWQSDFLNADISPDLPRGMRELTTEYFRERYAGSSLIILQIVWEDIVIDGETWNLPKLMWFADGSCIYIDGKTNNILDRKYYLNKAKTDELKVAKNKTVIIRKPFDSWNKCHPTPFLVKRGVLFNALVKQAIVEKQAQTINVIIPYLLTLKSGTDKLAELEQLVGIEKLTELKESLVKSQKEYDYTGELGKIIASLSYDTNIEHLIPDFKKLTDAGITEASDKNILAGLGMIEMVGFAKDRKEAILNPKVLIEEVKDGVADWASMIKEVTMQIKDRNAKKFPRLVKNTINVVPARIKAFLTDAMRDSLRSLADRGVLSYQSTVEDIAELDWNTELERNQKEEKLGLRDFFQPKPTQPIQTQQSKAPSDNTLPDRTPGTPESDNFTNASQDEFDLAKIIKEAIVAHYMKKEE